MAKFLMVKQDWHWSPTSEHMKSADYKKMECHVTHSERTKDADASDGRGRVLTAEHRMSSSGVSACSGASSKYVFSKTCAEF